MKRIVSTILSVALLGSMFGGVSANAEIRILDAETYEESFEETKDGDTFLRYRYYKTIDGVVYSCLDDHDSFEDVSVIAIKPTKPHSKVVIADEITMSNGNGYKTLPVIAIDVSNTSLNDNIDELVIGHNITSIKGLSGAHLKKVIFDKDFAGSEFSDVFNNCGKDFELVIPAENKYFEIKNNELYRIYGYGKSLIAVFSSPVNSYVIKEDTDLFHAPFASDAPVKSLTVRKDLKELKTGGMRQLTTINIGKNVKKIKEVDVSGATRLKNLDLSGVKVAWLTATGAKNLKSIVIPKDCKLGSYAFMGCKKLAKVTINNTKKAPQFYSEKTFKGTKSGIKFYVKNKKVAKSLKKRLKNSGVKKAKIYVGKKMVYKNVK